MLGNFAYLVDARERFGKRAGARERAEHFDFYVVTFGGGDGNGVEVFVDLDHKLNEQKHGVAQRAAERFYLVSVVFRRARGIERDSKSVVTVVAAHEALRIVASKLSDIGVVFVDFRIIAFAVGVARIGGDRGNRSLCVVVAYGEYGFGRYNVLAQLVRKRAVVLIVFVDGPRHYPIGIDGEIVLNARGRTVQYVRAFYVALVGGLFRCRQRHRFLKHHVAVDNSGVYNVLVVLQAHADLGGTTALSVAAEKLGFVNVLRRKPQRAQCVVVLGRAAFGRIGIGDYARAVWRVNVAVAHETGRISRYHRDRQY